MGDAPQAQQAGPDPKGWVSEDGRVFFEEELTPEEIAAQERGRKKAEYDRKRAEYDRLSEYIRQYEEQQRQRAQQPAGEQRQVTKADAKGTRENETVVRTGERDTDSTPFARPDRRGRPSAVPSGSGPEPEHWPNGRESLTNLPAPDDEDLAPLHWHSRGKWRPIDIILVVLLVAAWVLVIIFISSGDQSRPDLPDPMW